MELFERTFAMFAPFARRGEQPPSDAAAGGEPTDKPDRPASGSGDIDELKRQMEEMQKRLDRLGNTDKS
jgi:polyhydroxyalkanoate synthesis regulator protein